MKHIVRAVAWLCCIILAASARGDEPAPAAKRIRTLPGIQTTGAILLPNQWSIHPAGQQLELGDFPVNLALHPTGHWLAVLHAGYGTHEVIIIGLTQRKICCRVPLDQAFYGVTFSPKGDTLFASGGEREVVHRFRFDDGLLHGHEQIEIAPVRDTFVPAGMTIDAAGQTLFVAGPWGDAVCIVPLQTPAQRTKIPLGQGSYPYTCLLDQTGKRLFVSLWSKSAVAVIDLETHRVRETWATEKHPTEMALTSDGRTLFVACANSTQVSVLDTETGKSRETIGCSLYPNAPAGNTPNSLALTPDGALLFVANADANNVAVFNVGTPGQSKPLGFIPVGCYPTSVRFNPADGRLYVANARGTTPKANPQGPVPSLPANPTIRQYIAGLYRGTLGIVDMPKPEQMVEYTKQAYECSPLRRDLSVSSAPTGDTPIPASLGMPGPIHHVVYIIKENRTYDQVFGDMKEGNGDRDLCLFPEPVTPNHHKLAREFVLLDNFYVDGEVSADGHEWSMGGYATDFVRKTWPIAYRPGNLKKIDYPSEGAHDAIARPAGGYIWDRCAEAGLSYRSYGEWIANGNTPGDPGKARVPALEGHFDPQYRGFDLDYPDQQRADEFLKELARFDKEGEMPRFTVLHLPNDHTAGTRPGKHTPRALVADNDLALGRIVDGLSHSRFWQDLAIFVVEDDAQNGPDHVDAHRTVALLISPFTYRGTVDSNLYSTSSMLRTIELILGLKPMSQFDAAARPMYASFQMKPDVRPYEHLVPKVDLTEVNGRDAWGAARSEAFDLSKADAADDLALNEVIWHSVRGRRSRMPAPVRSAFVLPHQTEEENDN